MEGSAGFFYRRLKAVLTVISFARFLFPKLHIANEEEIMNFLNAFDLPLLFWVPFLNILGQEYKKLKRPLWAPPTPVVILLASFIISVIFGFIHCEAEGFKQILVVVVEYGIFNGSLMALIALGLFDVVVGIAQTQWIALKSLVAKIIAKIKAKKEAKA